MYVYKSAALGRVLNDLCGPPVRYFGQPWSRHNQISGLDEYCWQPSCLYSHKKFEETNVESVKI